MLSTNLKRLVKEKGFTVNGLARESGVNASYISHLMNGKKDNPSNEIIEKLCDALKITKDELLIEDPSIFEKTSEELDEDTKILFSKIKKLSPEDKKKISKMIEIFEGEVE